MKNNIVCLVGGGSIPSFIKEYTDQYPTIAIDGGANALHELEIIPSSIIGDLDSIDFSLYKEKILK